MIQKDITLAITTEQTEKLAELATLRGTRNIDNIIMALANGGFDDALNANLEHARAAAWMERGNA